MREHSTPEKECLQRIHDVAVGYDGEADKDCEQGSMKGLCKLINEMREIASKGLKGEWPEPDTFWVIEAPDPSNKGSYGYLRTVITDNTYDVYMTRNIHDALRFDSRAAAQGIIDDTAFQHAMGIRCNQFKVREHAWIDRNS